MRLHKTLKNRVGLALDTAGTKGLPETLVRPVSSVCKDKPMWKTFSVEDDKPGTHMGGVLYWVSLCFPGFDIRHL